MTSDADPFEEGQRAARKNIPGKRLAFVPRENRFPLFRIMLQGAALNRSSSGLS
jgi:hypothetical protein